MVLPFKDEKVKKLSLVNDEIGKAVFRFITD